MDSSPVHLSLVIPVLNEAGNLVSLHQRLTASLQGMGRPYEILLVDDGSSDASPAILEDLFLQDPTHVRVLEFRRNFGKTAALSAGFAHALGQVIITMDADL